jgi:hypothetical protein
LGEPPPWNSTSPAALAELKATEGGRPLLQQGVARPGVEEPCKSP